MVRYIVLITLLALSATGCSHLRSPETTVKDAYMACNAGEYSKAQELMSKDLIQAASGTGGVKALCDLNTTNGSIKSIEVGNTRIRGEGATVSMTLLFNDGSKRGPFEAPAVKEDGVWKVALSTN